MFRRLARFGDPSAPAGGFNPTQRYETGPNGTAVPSDPPGIPALADGIFRLGNTLEASKTGKPGGIQSLGDEPPYTAQPLDAITPVGRFRPTGIGGPKVIVKLAAKGYVNPADIALRRGVRGQPIVSEDVEFKA